jgi:hypothetical protein
VGSETKKEVKKEIGKFFSTKQSIHPTTTTTPHPVPSPLTTLDDDPVGIDDCPNRTTKKNLE